MANSRSRPAVVGDLVDEAALGHDAQEIGFEGGHVLFSGKRQRAVAPPWQSGRARLASARWGITRMAEKLALRDRPDERHVDGRHRHRDAEHRRRRPSSSSGRRSSCPTTRRFAAGSRPGSKPPRRSSGARIGRVTSPRWSARSRLRHADAVEAFLAQWRRGWGKPEVIGFHGQTVLHRPQAGADRAARRRRAAVATDRTCRSSTTCAPTTWRIGGQGAPLVPAYHAALARSLPAPFAARIPGRLRQYRRHLQHHLSCRRPAIRSPSTPGPATR